MYKLVRLTFWTSIAVAVIFGVYVGMYYICKTFRYSWQGSSGVTVRWLYENAFYPIHLYYHKDRLPGYFNIGSYEGYIQGRHAGTSYIRDKNTPIKWQMMLSAEDSGVSEIEKKFNGLLVAKYGFRTYCVPCIRFKYDRVFTKDSLRFSSHGDMDIKIVDYEITGIGVYQDGDYVFHTMDGLTNR